MRISSGLYRKTDRLGRITIPKEIRDSMGIVDDTSYLEIIKVNSDEIVLRKASFKAVLHMNDKDVAYYKCLCGNRIELSQKNEFIYCPKCGNRFIWD